METAEIKVLPEQQKRDLCLDLLNEFGASKVRERKDELHHNCVLPFGGHSDNNSFAASLNYSKLAFNCYVCGYGGSLAWWIAACRGEDVDKTEPWLRQKLGIGSSLPIGDLLRVIDSIYHPPAKKRILPKYPMQLLDRWTDWGIFHPYLTDPAPYGRAIPEENLERCRIGYADSDEDFGYHQRIIIPVFFESSLVGWQARRLSRDDPDWEIKYKNSLDFPRESVLYTAPDLLDRRVRTAVVVESPFSVLRHLHQIPVVATFGSNVTDEQLNRLGRIDRLILFNENDKAGWKMTRHISRALARSNRVDVVQNPYNGDVDPADLDDETFMSLVEGAVPASIWQPRRYDQMIPYAG
jgi:hypothetical protein